MSSGASQDTGGQRMKDRLAALKDKLPDQVDKEVDEPLDEVDEDEAEESAEDVWDEDYDEHIDGEEPPPPRSRKPRRYGAIAVIVIIVLFMIIWTILSPDVVPQSGNTYLESQRYANLSGFSGEVGTWAGDSTWAVSVGGPNQTAVGSTLNISVLVSKVSENVANWWFRGTGISLKNVSLYLDDGSFVGAMTNRSDLGFGLLAHIPITFSEPGNHEVYAYVKFVMYSDMRLGFLPVKAVEIESDRFVISVT